MIKIELNPKKLYEACILSSLTHAVAVGMYLSLIMSILGTKLTIV